MLNLFKTCWSDIIKWWFNNIWMYWLVFIWYSDVLAWIWTR